MAKPPKMPRTRYWRLYRAISTSVVDAFCCRHPLLKALLHLLCLPPALELTRLATKLEHKIARDGHLKGACEWLISIAAKDIHIQGAENVPRAGPLLFMANHAGLGDAHALLMASPRLDTRILAQDFGLLPGLPQFRRHVILVDKKRPQAALRAGLRHLRSGGSLLLYPRGEIEADPALDLSAALASLPAWTRSSELFARQVPNLAILPVAGGGFISRAALRNPLVKRYKKADQRHFLAATFQLLFPFYRDPVISLHFGCAISGAQATRENALRQMAELLPRVYAEQQALRQNAPPPAKLRRDLHL